MPAVLIEVGFVNHASDRAAMLDTKFQDSMATAITKGVKVFLGDVKEETGR
jgi:N-acetylmuramoyl-L-alanine amidase